MRLFGLIGFPLSHSFSERYFTDKFAREGIADAVYKAFPITDIHLVPDLIKSHPNLLGFNVTIPYKEAIIPFLDELDETARVVGAVNTVVCQTSTPLGLTGKETSLGLTGKETSLGLTGKETSLGLTGKETSLGLTGKETSLSLTGKETSLGLTGKETSLGLTGKESPLGLTGKETPLGLTGKETSLGLTDKATPLDLTGDAKEHSLRSDSNVKWVGYNTDVYGFRQSIKPFLASHHERALILGTGGASKAVEHVLREIGVECVFVARSSTFDNATSVSGTNRTVLKYSDLNEHVMAMCKLIVNCTPVGTFPNENEAPAIPYEFLTPDHFLYDLVYNPAETEFIKHGKLKGAMVMNGLDMLKMQAEEAWKIWNRQ